MNRNLWMKEYDGRTSAGVDDIVRQSYAIRGVRKHLKVP
jgi:hypothetical protein